VLLDTLLELERELATGGGDTYRRLLRPDAIVIVPGQALDAEATARSIDESPGWDEVALEDGRVLELADGVALLTYRFSGRRGEDFAYAALMTSGWTRGDDGWRLAFHQQTPL
jgi:Domain of unknown function (DUF4440)